MSELTDLILSHGEENEGTAYPFWYVAVKGGAVLGRPVMISHGFWFNRADAEKHLENKAHRYPKTAFVYCDSGHDSWHIRLMYELAIQDSLHKVQCPVSFPIRNQLLPVRFE